MKLNSINFTNNFKFLNFCDMILIRKKLKGVKKWKE